MTTNLQGAIDTTSFERQFAQLRRDRWGAVPWCRVAQRRPLAIAHERARNQKALRI
jgi:hypothetical protein